MRIKLPLVIVNLKVYPEAIEKPLYFASVAKKISDEIDVNIAVAPPLLNLRDVVKIAPTFAQTIDPSEPGAYTGSITAEEIKSCGAIGAIINHAERRLNPNDIGRCVKKCNKNELISIVCVKDDFEAREYAEARPDFIAIEPPELIGGKESVMQTNPEIIERSVKVVKEVSDKVDVICGGGVKSTEDVKKALELGTVGIMVSSNVVKAVDVEKSLREIANGCL